MFSENTNKQMQTYFYLRTIATYISIFGMILVFIYGLVSVLSSYKSKKVK
jgi:nitric oxide reductase large subunit